VPLLPDDPKNVPFTPLVPLVPEVPVPEDILATIHCVPLQT
jgi:hypothetical protein